MRRESTFEDWLSDENRKQRGVTLQMTEVVFSSAEKIRMPTLRGTMDEAMGGMEISCDVANVQKLPNTWPEFTLRET